MHSTVKVLLLVLLQGRAQEGAKVSRATAHLSSSTQVAPPK